MIRNDFSYPIGCTLRFRFAARGDQPALDLFWYDGGMKPRLPGEVEAHDIEMPAEGILFVGDQGTIMADFHGQKPHLFAQGKTEPLSQKEALPPDGKRGPTQHSGRLKAWIQAVQGGEPSAGSFLNAGPITDAVNLGTVALRAGRKVLFDSANMKITNLADANKYLYREYRKGWEL